ncbi:ComEA family DNA-binding protein [Actinomadura flavalba]|uniref:ComEA family DNA-binding protein n=1 Tax=Actinomadura flavalba TaxID=1120938 RepID=UPI00037D36E8|nr:ComEA family DNA-binding protein [Actinomadura flavalba]
MRFNEPLKTAGAPPSSKLRGGPDMPRMSAKGARVILLAAVVATVVAVAYLWLSWPRAEAAPEPVAPTAHVSPVSAQAPPPSPEPSAASVVLVHMLGKVRRPGVVELPSGSRVVDALKAAGGTRPGTTTGSLNLARRLVDGEQIPIGVKGAPPSPTSPPADPGATGAPPGNGALIDLNTATLESLQTLPGVGPVLAQRIIDHRTRQGPFRSIDQLQDVSGIGPRRFTDLKPLVRADPTTTPPQQGTNS